MKRTCIHAAAWAAFVAAAIAAAPAHAASVYTFDLLNNDSGSAAAQTIADTGQFQVEVEPGAVNATWVQFTISNLNLAPSVASSITEIYWEDTSLLNYDDYLLASGWNANTAPPDLPGQNNATPPFITEFAADSDNPGQTPDVPLEVGDSASFEIALSGSNTLADVIAAMDAGTFRLGLHVRGIGPTGAPSASYITTGAEAVVPVPPAAAAGVLGLAIVGLIQRRRTVRQARK